MSQIHSINKRKVFASILICIFVFFVFILSLVTIKLSFYYQEFEYKKLVLEADRLSSLEKNISLEQAIKIFNPKIPINVFNEKCDQVFTADLLILKEHCLKRVPELRWLEITGANNRKLIISFDDSWLNFKFFYDEIGSYLLLISLFFLIFISILLTFFYFFFINAPIKKVSLMVDKLLETKNINSLVFDVKPDELLFNLYQCILKLVNEVIIFNKQSEKMKLSRQIAHDLRAPLSILEDYLQKESTLSSRSALAIKKLREITNELMPEDKNYVETLVNFNQLFNELKELHQTKELKISTPKDIPPLKLSICQIDLFRSFSNLSKNSLEAGANKIEINFFLLEGSIHITFKDNGIGIDPASIPEILNGATTKINGNGIGLSSLVKKINEIKGRVEIESNLNHGFVVKIKIPYSYIVDNKTSYVLIDDDKFIRISWKNRAESSGVSFFAFESVEDFLNKLSNIPIESIIYIDSCLKDGVQGELEAKKIYENGFKEIYLATGYNKSDFNLVELPWIKDIVSKTPPFF